MDPGTIAGVAIGAVSLSIQVLDGIFKAYKVFDGCLGMQADCQYVSTCFSWERERLRDWAISVGLDQYKDEGSVSGSIRNNRLPLLAILTEIRTAITKFLVINAKYSEMKVKELAGENNIAIDGVALAAMLDLTNIPLQADSLTFGEKAKNFGKDVKEVVAHPRRLKWVGFDKKRANELLKKLHDLNNCLHELLDDHQTKVLLETTKNTQIELVQMHNTVSGLRYLMEAAILFRGSLGQQFEDDASSLDSGRSSIDSRVSSLISLVELVKFKEINLQGGRTHASLSINNIPEGMDLERIGRTPASYRNSEGLNAPIWIEWKEFKVGIEGGKLQDNPPILPRIEELATLLTSGHPKEFCVPPCLGFVKVREFDNDTGHFGFVFEAPPDASSKKNLISLSTALKGGTEPSLSDRYALAGRVATAMLYLHSVNWLHKGFHTQNVVWFSNAEPISYESAYIMGFEYSRPSRAGEKTEDIPFDMALEPYRHPDIQGVGKHPHYRKTFDVYSLGIVLLEIALWEKIVKIYPDIIDDTDYEEEDDLVEQPNTPQNEKLSAFQSDILNGESSLSAQIRSKVGNVYYDAIKACISGRKMFGISRQDDETDPMIAVKLQQMFKKLVADPLRKVVL